MNYNENISPTAWGCAYRRSLTDIPYSQEIFEEFNKIRLANNGPEIAKEMLRPEITPMFEARFKLINRLLAENHIEQILDVAAGLTPRGISMTENESVCYVELDLPTMISHKIKIVDEILQKKKTKHNHLYFEIGNALEMDSFNKAAEHFDIKKPIAIVHEGLLRYLNLNEKTAVIENIKTLLLRFDGVWITSDVPTKENGLQRDNSSLNKLTGINIDSNLFETVGEAKKFYESFGFEIEDHPFSEIKSELVSPDRLKLSAKNVDNTIENLSVFVMRLKN